jgi:O-acetylhomoserine/O-acetylserine sulfhydrylase-like pyridoxal-dependent enzyme
MPLRVDENYRGPRAFHVRSHRKLGKHRTIIKPALSVVNWLIEHPNIAKVDFGKMIGGQNHAKFSHRINITEKGKVLKVMLVAKDAAQAFTVTVRSLDTLDEVVAEIRKRWMLLNAAND